MKWPPAQSGKHFTQVGTARRSAKPPTVAGRTAGIAVATGVATLFNLGMTIATARVLGPQGRGVIALVMTIGASVSLVCSLGVNTAAKIYMPHADSDVNLGDYESLALLLTLISAAVSLALASLVVPNAQASIRFYVLVAGYSASCSLSYMALDAVNAFNFLVSSSAINAGGSLAQLLGVSLLWRLDQLTIDRTIALLIFGLAFQTVASLALLAANDIHHLPRIRLRVWSRLLRTGMPALGVNAGQSFTFRIDRYVVAAFMGTGPLGIYSIAVSGSEVLRVLPSSLGQLFFYRIASKSGDVLSVRRQRRFMLLLMIPLLAVWALIAPTAIRVLVGPRYLAAVTPLRILLIGEIGVMAFQIDSRVVTALGKTISAGLVGLFGLAVVFPLDLILIRNHGLDGAAIASVVAYLAMGAGAALLLRATSRPRPDRRPTARYPRRTRSRLIR